MMEQHRIPRRSASHGTLRSSYSSHGGPGVGPTPFRPLHKPLRSVNENSVLLHSPGALESMLKTTTETGDIGIFTIRPVPPSPLRPRDTISEVGHLRPRPRRSIDSLYRQNLGMRPPSHRDAISEVFSVYGSESLKSGTSTVSPNSTDDPGQRSYSMTTCGSRHLSHHKSTNTLQSQASGGSNLQRPRSPFPYPTRLKRPGVRPASPAVTENGQIDYSRMVEIDRVSYRTVHGHFKHAYSPMSRRPQPLGLRTDMNRSTPSLLPPGPPPNYHGPPRPPSVRTYSPASMVSWNAHFHERLEGTSTRTSSLTSVTNIYRRMPPIIRTGQTFPAEPPPRYYDYTEDFEDTPPRFNPLTQAFMPLNTRTIGYPQSKMLQEDEDHLAISHLAAVFGEGDSAFYDCESQMVDEQEALPVLATIENQNQSGAETSDRSIARQHPDSAPSQNSTAELEVSENGMRNSDIDLLPSQIGRESIDTFNPSLDVESRDVLPPYNYVTYHANTTPKTKTKSPKKPVQVLGGQALTIRSEQGVILRDGTPDETTGRQTPASCESYVENRADKPHSSAQPHETLSNNNLECQNFRENHALSVQDKPQGYEISLSLAERLAPEPILDSPRPRGSISPPTEESARKSGEVTEDEARQIQKNSKPDVSHDGQFRRHRRNHAALRISTTNLPRDDNEGHPHITPTCSTVPLVSPKPISPARQLRVKNSIPQLMKTLPPLPGSLGYDLPTTTTEVSEEDEFTEILIPFGFHGSDEQLQRDQPQVDNLEPITSGGMVLNPKREGPKFRLKIKTNGGSEASLGDENAYRLESLIEANIGDEIGEKNRNQNKLKVRSPRRSVMNSSQSSTIRHNPSLEAPQVITDIVRRGPRDIFTVTPKPEAMLLRKRRKPLPHLACPQAVDKFNVPTPVPLDKRVNATGYQASPNASTDKYDMDAIDKDKLIGSIPSHGLMKRLSNLRTFLHSSTPSTPQIRSSDTLRITTTTSNSFQNTDLDIRKSTRVAGSPASRVDQRRFGQRIRARLSRWAKSAETAMRKCVNKKRDHHKQEGNEQT
ncbi:hypothetical protein NUW58_g4908 [Xylaria curta]|uniref:Uncharacterized protein n=1 Tax=Xylaria curta TaxID=42375 RepID=A0ACC1P4A2_9PEZI|nr:hypothetical protein NUW58_g4908 [Xylaria curta]